MRTRYEYIVKSVKYPLDKLVYEAYKDKLAKYGEVEFTLPLFERFVIDNYIDTER